MSIASCAQTGRGGIDEVVGSARRSLIASANALFRMAETRRPDGLRLVNDPWAGLMAERHLLLEALRYVRFVVPKLRQLIDEAQTAHCIRHSTIDALILEAVRHGGFRQVVVVGAGYDMRPARFAADLRGVHWIEVDQPSILERKQQVLERAGLVGRPMLESGGGPGDFPWVRGVLSRLGLSGLARPAALQVERAGVDLIFGRLQDALRQTGFDPDQPALFVLEGLIHYLPIDRVEALLEDITRGSGRRRVVLSFIRTDVFRTGRRRLEWLMTLLGEIPQLHLRPEELAALCALYGLGRLSRWTLEEQVDAFAPRARDRLPRLGQDVVQVESTRR